MHDSAFVFVESMPGYGQLHKINNKMNANT